MKKTAIVAGVVALLVSATAIVQAAVSRPEGGGQSLPFTFYMTHYELLGDMSNPSGVRYHSNGEPFALAKNGSKVILSGQGSWDPASERAAGGGHYVIRGPKGGIKAQGPWHATKFLSFKMLRGWWGIDNFKEQGWQGPPGSASFSGFLKLKVTLEGQGSGVLTAWCLMPTVPKPGDHIGDGITLTGGPFRFTNYHKSERSLEGMMFYSP